MGVFMLNSVTARLLEIRDYLINYINYFIHENILSSFHLIEPLKMTN